jgi:CBS domain-containing protein
MEDDLDDELEIMSQRASSRVSVDDEVFEQPLDVLNKQPAVSVDHSVTVGEARAKMRANRVGAMLVTKDGKLVGIMTERDLLMKAELAEEWAKKNVTEIMTPNPECLLHDDAVKFVMQRMHVGRYRHVPVVDDNYVPLYVISVRNLLGFILDQFPRLVTNIPPRPSRGAPPWGG